MKVFFPAALLILLFQSCSKESVILYPVTVSIDTSVFTSIISRDPNSIYLNPYYTIAITRKLYYNKLAELINDPQTKMTLVDSGADFTFRLVWLEDSESVRTEKVLEKCDKVTVWEALWGLDCIDTFTHHLSFIQHKVHFEVLDNHRMNGYTQEFISSHTDQLTDEPLFAGDSSCHEYRVKYYEGGSFEGMLADLQKSNFIFARKTIIMVQKSH
jgi:hypothetical protein